ncbi:hypothetical protein EHQ76_19350 [Leptospira barantonii]|uniref:Glycosyltransferase RgtA/B/C/D-like domain-containing protein n=1 Tax=Leptospira barantonii TaxID=2023184 RepID=A0A5F2AYA2_9LEPT|nr:hypothetical protein [Leptospira barantonii]TGL92957.1 hypothetical protein EHQ76_19350 [Leptospira barantonii]
MDLPAIVFFKRISGRIILFLFAFLLYSFLFYQSAWLSDDSFITFRVVDNFLNGFGLRWNPLERVQVFTHPLWLFLLIPIEWAIREISISAYLLSYVCGILFLSVYCFSFFRFRNGLLWITLSFGVFFSSRIFIDYNTSGLENPLSFLLLLIFQIKFYSLYAEQKSVETESTSAESEKKSNGTINSDSFEIGLLSALLLLTRLDLGLFLILPGFVFLGRIYRDHRIPFLKYSFLGILPLIFYLGFSLVYYGSFFPNTFYAKTNVLSSFSERIVAGWDYLRISLKWDPIVTFVFGFHLIWIFVDLASSVLSRFSNVPLKFRWKLSREERAILGLSACSILLAFLYLLWVGGDFMAGRFLGTCLILSVFSQSLVLALRAEQLNLNIQKFAIVSCIVVAIYFLAHPASPFRYTFARSPVRVDRGVVDERASYQDNSSLKRWMQGVTPETHPWAVYGKKIGQNGNAGTNERGGTTASNRTGRDALTEVEAAQRVHVTTNVGLAGYYGGPSVHWIDLLGITDPFLARLPGKGFPGHYVRLLPSGYREYIEEISASLPNPLLDRFYYEVRLLSEEELWTNERWVTIFNFTFLGKGNFRAVAESENGFYYPFDLEAYRNTLYGFPYANMKDDELSKLLIREYFGRVSTTLP